MEIKQTLFAAGGSFKCLSFTPLVSGHRAAAEGVCALSGFVIVPAEQKPKATQRLRDM